MQEMESRESGREGVYELGSARPRSVPQTWQPVRDGRDGTEERTTTGKRQNLKVFFRGG